MTKTLFVARHELKYYIHRNEYELLKRRLSQIMQPDPYQQDPKGYFIRSLYFDTYDDRAVYEKLDGVERRKKFRLRIYDVEQDWAKLECKAKENQYVQKRSVHLSREESLALIGGNVHVLRTHRDLAAIQIYTDLLRSAHRPVVLVDYLRDAFILPYNQIRVTFDQYVRTQSIPCSLYQPDLARLPNQAQDMVIMEIKFQHRLPPWFAQVVSPSSAIHMAISKYCAGRIPQMDFYHEHAIISQ